MPNRIVREGFLDSEAINTLEWFTECVYHRLLIVVDDAGRFDGRGKIIASRCFPLRENVRSQTVEESLAKLKKAALIIPYTFQEKPYIQVTKWQLYGNSKFSKFPWIDGSYNITFVTLKTRDGEKEYVSTSIPSSNSIDTAYQSHPDPIPTPSVSGEAVVADVVKNQKFVPPTIEEVAAYIKEKNYTDVDASKWWHFYDGKGWMIGKTKMKNWRSAVVTWHKKETDRTCNERREELENQAPISIPRLDI